MRIRFGWTQVAYLVIFAAAIGLRFWDLGGQALHHDESIHAQWSWRLTQGDYTHDPIFHGPFYYHVQGLVFLLFGASDYTARLSAALFGSGLVALPLLLRRKLGGAGTMTAVALIAFSPTIVYYSRFFREDIYYAFFTLAMIATMWRYMEEGRDRWLYFFAAAFTGSITTKEATFLSVAVFLVFLDVYLAYELAVTALGPRTAKEDRLMVCVLTIALAPIAWGIAALWPFLGPIRRNAFEDRELPLVGDVLILLGTLILPLLTALGKGPLDTFGVVDKTRLVCTAAMANSDRIVMGGLFAVTTSAAALVGLQWRPKTWGIAFGMSAVIYLTLMTSFWTNFGGLCTGPWGSLDYWRTQQDFARGGQPWFYYDMLMPMYEFLPLALCIGGLWWSVVRGNAFSRFVVFWLAGMWIALSWAGEKMPWLNTHLALPACILAAWTVQRAWQSWTNKPRTPVLASVLVGTALIASGASVAAVYVGVAYGSLFGLAIAAAGLAFVVFAARPYGRRAAPLFAVVAVAAGLAYFSLLAMVRVTFDHRDDPRDLLIYTQSSGDIPLLRNNIDDLARATGLGYQLPIAIDSTDSYAWPWAWYLRDYKRVSYIDMGTAPNVADFQVILVNTANTSKVNDALLSAGGANFGGAITYHHRWWFDETYKNELSTGPWDTATLGTVKDGIFGGGWLPTWFHYWLNHDPGSARPNGSTDGVAFFPANFDRKSGKLLARPATAPKPTVDTAGRPTFGGSGLLPGQFVTPIDIEKDADGNLYVIDKSSKRLQKFDRDGNFINSVDIRVNPATRTKPPSRGDSPSARTARSLSPTPSAGASASSTATSTRRISSLAMRPTRTSRSRVAITTSTARVTPLSTHPATFG